MRKSYIINTAAVLSALTLTTTLANVTLATSPAWAGPPPTPVSACGTLGTPGRYVLTTNLGPVAGTCLVISAPNVTLNLAGHTITGMKLGTSTGIELLASAVHATIGTSKPGAAVVAFHAGIQDYANNAVIEGPGLLLTDNVGAGVFLFKVIASVVRGANLSGNGYFGANVQLSQGVVLRGNNIDMNTTYGIWVQSTVASRFVDNVVDNSGVAGIYLGCSDTANLQEVGCQPSDGSLVKGNILHNNGPYGIAIADVSLDNRIDMNTALGAVQAGLWDENAGCSGPTAPPNVWQQNVGSRNQTVSATCIG